jgi:hypothetical protein
MSQAAGRCAKGQRTLPTSSGYCDQRTILRLDGDAAAHGCEKAEQTI